MGCLPFRSLEATFGREMLEGVKLPPCNEADFDVVDSLLVLNRERVYVRVFELHLQLV